MLQLGPATPAAGAGAGIVAQHGLPMVGWHHRHPHPHPGCPGLGDKNSLGCRQPWGASVCSKRLFAGGKGCRGSRGDGLGDSAEMLPTPPSCLGMGDKAWGGTSHGGLQWG